MVCRCFYLKQPTLHSRSTFYQFMHFLGIESVTLVLLALCCTVAQLLWTTVVMLLILLRCFYVILKLKISSPSRAQQCFPFFSSCLGSGSIPIGIFKKSLLKSCNPQTKLDKKTKLQGCELNGFNERKDCNPVKQ